ncbi:hypothetical protein CR513_10786, partial [Mucuna pruriens]
MALSLLISLSLATMLSSNSDLYLLDRLDTTLKHRGIAQWSRSTTAGMDSDRWESYVLHCSFTGNNLNCGLVVIPLLGGLLFFWYKECEHEVFVDVPALAYFKDKGYSFLFVVTCVTQALVIGWMFIILFHFRSVKYLDGLNKFLDLAFENRFVNGAIRCSCLKCHYNKWETRDFGYDMVEHMKLWHQGTLKQQ